MSDKPAPFCTTFNEKEFSKYDWTSLTNRKTLSGKLKKLCDKLRERIEEHTRNVNFISHSNLYDLFNNIFSAYLLWNNFNLNVYLLIGSLSISISEECQLLILSILSLHWQKI
eukprot:251184_1